MVSLFCGAVVVNTFSMGVSHEQKIVIQHALAAVHLADHGNVLASIHLSNLGVRFSWMFFVVSAHSSSALHV